MSKTAHIALHKRANRPPAPARVLARVDIVVPTRPL
jgi:hypothetical protein